MNDSKQKKELLKMGGFCIFFKFSEISPASDATISLSILIDRKSFTHSCGSPLSHSPKWSSFSNKAKTMVLIHWFWWNVMLLKAFFSWEFYYVKLLIFISKWIPCSVISP